MRQPAHRVVVQDGVDARLHARGGLVGLGQPGKRLAQGLGQRRRGAVGGRARRKRKQLCVQQRGSFTRLGQVGAFDRLARLHAQRGQHLGIADLLVEQLAQTVAQPALDAIVGAEHHVARHRFAQFVRLPQEARRQRGGRRSDALTALEGHDLGQPPGLVVAADRVDGRRGRLRRLEGLLPAAPGLAVHHHPRNQRGQLGVACVDEGVVAVGVHVAFAQLVDRQCAQAPRLHDVLEPQAAGAEDVAWQGATVAAVCPARQRLQIFLGAGQVGVAERGRPLLLGHHHQHALAVQHLRIDAGAIIETGVAVLDAEALGEERGGGVALGHGGDALLRYRQQIFLVVGRLAEQQRAARDVEGLAALLRQMHLVVGRRHRPHPLALVATADERPVHPQRVIACRLQRLELLLHRRVRLFQRRRIARVMMQRLRRHQRRPLVLGHQLALLLGGLVRLHGVPGLVMLAEGGDGQGHLQFHKAAAIVGAQRQGSAIHGQRLERMRRALDVIEHPQAQRAFHDMVTGHHLQQRALHARPVLALRSELGRQVHQAAARGGVGIAERRQQRRRLLPVRHRQTAATGFAARRAAAAEQVEAPGLAVVVERPRQHEGR